MAETNLEFSKIVSTPTPIAWSQAYSAGRLFAVISLQTDTIPEEGQDLATIGKDLISILESEFFTLENKDLDSIKQAILTTTARVKQEIKLSLVVCFLSDNVLYLFASGGGKAILKRGDKIGTVLEGEDGTNIKSASGYVQDKDLIILQTKSFLKIIPSSTLASSMDNNSPEEIAENLAPGVHEKSEGGASAVILMYKEGAPDIVLPIENEEATTEGQTPNDEVKTEESPIENLNEEPEETGQAEALQNQNQASEEIDEPEETKPETVAQTPPEDELSEDLSSAPSPFLSDQFPKKRRLSFAAGLGIFRKIPLKLPRQRRIIAIIAVVLIALIAITSFLALGNKQSSQNKKLFTTVYQEANSKYEEGQNLKDLNASLSQQSFKDAQKILEENKGKFKDGSSEEKQILVLLSKVNSEISKSSTGESVTPQEATTNDSKILSYELNNKSASYFTQNADNVYFLDGSGISIIDKGNDKKSQAAKKTWKTEGGIGLFGSNVYVLDKADGISKFVPASDGSYSETDYFADNAPDLLNAVSMAIDGSVYIFFKDGTIDKYTRAKKDDFSISGLDKSFSSPTRIFTDADTDNIYILDNGNSRIVVLDKNGKFVKAYSASILKSAKDFDVAEKTKKIFVLSGGKIYQINL